MGQAVAGTKAESSAHVFPTLPAVRSENFVCDIELNPELRSARVGSGTQNMSVITRLKTPACSPNRAGLLHVE